MDKKKILRFSVLETIVLMFNMYDKKGKFPFILGHARFSFRTGI